MQYLTNDLFVFTDYRRRIKSKFGSSGKHRGCVGTYNLRIPETTKRMHSKVTNRAATQSACDRAQTNETTKYFNVPSASARKKEEKRTPEKRWDEFKTNRKRWRQRQRNKRRNERRRERKNYIISRHRVLHINLIFFFSPRYSSTITTAMLSLLFWWRCASFVYEFACSENVSVEIVWRFLWQTMWFFVGFPNILSSSSELWMSRHLDSNGRYKCASVSVEKHLWCAQHLLQSMWTLFNGSAPGLSAHLAVLFFLFLNSGESSFFAIFSWPNKWNLFSVSFHSSIIH